MKNTRSLKQLVGNSSIMLVFGGLMFSGCNDVDDTQPTIDDEVAEVVISPDTANIAVGEELEFSVLAFTNMGDTINPADVGITWEWWSTDVNVFTVEQDGTATGENPGDAFCVVEYHIPYNAQNISKTSARMARVNALKGFVGRDSAVVHIF